MTTEQPSVQRILRRRSDDRVIAGVANGLGEFLNVDPLLIRIGFVGLMVFGGLGLLLYVGAWLLVPEEGRDDSIIEQLLERAGLTTSRFLVGLLLVVGALLFFGGMGNAVAYSDIAIGLGVALMVIVLGGVILRQGKLESGAIVTPVRAPVPKAAPRVDSVVARPARVARQQRKRARSPLGWYVLGAMLTAIGLLALATNVSGAAVDLGQFFGVALAVLGVGLVFGAWWGSARLLILLGILLLPPAIAASFITTPIEGGLGYHRFSPTSPDELRAEYRLVGGQVELDLTNVEAGSEPVEIAASVAVGEVFVLLPADAGIELDADVGLGGLFLFGAYQSGTALEDRYAIDGRGPRFVLGLEAGIGAVRVMTASMEDR